MRRGPETIVVLFEDLDVLGHHQLIHKADQEPAARAVQRVVSLQRPGFILENCLVNEPRSNRRAENEAKRVVEVTRAIKDRP